MAVSCAPRYNVLHESTSRKKKAYLKFLSLIKDKGGTLSIVVVDNERESV